MAIPSDATPVDYTTIIYNKTEIDAYNTAEQTRVNTALDAKADVSDLGSPNGIATLDENGKVTQIELPYSTLLESSDDTNNNTIITPERLHYQIEAKTISSSKIGAANGIAPLGADSLVPAIYLPAIPSHGTYVVLTLQDMYDLPLTKTINEGDRAIVTNEPTDVGGDKNGEYVADINTPSFSDWSKLPNLSLVGSVNGQTGTVVITSIAESATNAADIIALDTRLGTAESTITNHANTLSSHTTSINTNSSDILALETLTGTHTNDISSNTASIGTHTTQISDLDSRLTVQENGHQLIVSATSTASSQQPLFVDTPLQVEYGVEQVTANITVAANGSITFHTAGKYLVSIKMQYGRFGANGTSVMLFRWKKNGTQYGQTLSTKIDNAEVLVPWASTDIIEVGIGDVLVSEIMRDSSGDNSGGLFSTAPTAAGWNSAPCASLIIHKVF